MNLSSQTDGSRKRMINKKFIAIDGEGYDGKYALLASLHGSIQNVAGLDSLSCIRFLHELARVNPNSIFIGFGIGYDVNMMLKDLPDESLIELLDEDINQTRFGDYILRYYPKKIFEISKGNVKFKWFDTFSFFGCSFISALTKFLPTWPTLEKIAQGKMGRSTFSASQLPAIKRYNELELHALEALIIHLDTLFQSQGIYLEKWHGPGALASFLISSAGFDIVADFPRFRGSFIPNGLLTAWNTAFFGGRIENILTGTLSNVNAFDINSAYPFSASLLPRHLPARFWKHGKTRRVLDDTLSLYLCEWNVSSRCKIGPFPFRDSHGLISFPLAGKGWYYKPEVDEAINLFGNRIRILEFWTQEREELSRMASVLPEIYRKRKELKQLDNPAEFVLKLSLNSIYGKFAQRKGKPQYRCPAYAGFITSKTRSQLLACSRETEVLAFATDSIFTRDSPDVKLSNELGEWKLDNYDSFTCIQNGFYKLGDTLHSKQANRGIPKVNWNDLIKQLEKNGAAKFTDRVFVTHKMAICNPIALGPHRLKFIDRSKIIRPFATTKRQSDIDKLEDWTHNYVLSNPPRFAPEEMSRPIE